jgi:hypothetical protein
VLKKYRGIGQNPHRSRFRQGTEKGTGDAHAFFIPVSPRRAEPVPAPGLMLATLNLLIPRGFAIPIARICEFYFAVQQRAQRIIIKDFTGELFFPQ